jgi:predicted GNAT family N-acyltransferase
MQVKIVSSKDVIPLRHKILRPGQDVKTASFAGDELPTTTHHAVINHNEIIAVLSLNATAQVPKDLEFLDFPPNAFVQLRGMAVNEEYQGKGVGKFLVEAVFDDLRQKKQYKYLWCNARTYALPFYQKLGFIEVGEEFMNSVGPHYIMYVKI